MKVLLNSLCIADPSQSLSQSVSYFQLVGHLVSYSVYPVIQSVTQLVILSARHMKLHSQSVSQSGTQLHSQSVSCSISHSVSQSGTQLHSQSVAQPVIQSAGPVPNCTVSQSVAQLVSIWYCKLLIQSVIQSVI